MNRKFLEYELFRDDRIYAYEPTDVNNVFKLKFTTFYYGEFPTFSIHSNILNTVPPIKNIDNNPIFFHPISSKHHSCLYTDGFNIIDGYGDVWDELKLNGDKIYYKNNFFTTISHFKYQKSIKEWCDNIKEEKWDNIFGIIPDTVSDICNKNIQSFYPLYYPTWNFTVNFYKSPDNLKTFTSQEKKLFESGI